MPVRDAACFVFPERGRLSSLDCSRTPAVAFRLSPSSSVGARFLPFPLSRSGLSTDTDTPCELPRNARQERQFALRLSPGGWLTQTPLPACAFRLVVAPMPAVRSEELLPISVPCTTTLAVCVIPRADLRRRMGQASVHSFLAALASGASTALSRARSRSTLASDSLVRALGFQ